MTNSNTKNQEHPLEGLMRRIAKAPTPSKQDIDQIKAKFDNEEPTTYESAYMNENGEISVKIFQYLAGGVVTHGWYTCKTGDQDYDDIIKRHGPLKPDEGHTIIQKLVDGKWINSSAIPIIF